MIIENSFIYEKANGFECLKADSNVHTDFLLL